MSDVTRILTAIEQGDASAANELLPLVYNELRKLAAHKMASLAAGQTLQPTALVHEAWLRLTGSENAKFENRRHFFAAASEAMRHILIDDARRKRAERHGAGYRRVDLEEVEVASLDYDDQLVAVNEALEKLAAEQPLEAELVKLRFFVGLTLVEAAEILGISERTARRHWVHAKLWLYREMTAAKE